MTVGDFLVADRRMMRRQSACTAPDCNPETNETEFVDLLEWQVVEMFRLDGDGGASAELSKINRLPESAVLCCLPSFLSLME